MVQTDMFCEMFDGFDGSDDSAAPAGFIARGKGSNREPILDSYDFILVNTSAGKDSQAMLDEVVILAKRAKVLDRVVAVHCDLGKAEWEGCPELAKDQADHYGVPFRVVKNQRDFLERTLHRDESIRAAGKKTPPWPGQQTRWCTAELKNAPVKKLMTTMLKKLSRLTRFLNCLGLRAEESGMRAMCKVCAAKESPSELKGKARQNYEDGKGRWVPMSQCWACGGTGKRAHLYPASDKEYNRERQVDVWLPIHSMRENGAGGVWDRIAESGAPSHPAYDIGMPRLSCCFCIYSSRSGLVLAGHYNRKLLDQYVEVERKVGFTFTQSTSLEEIREEVRRTTIEGASRALRESLKRGEKCGPTD